MPQKVFVSVTVRHELDGSMTPLSIAWEDGRVFEVDRVVDVCRAASLKVGGMGWRYTVRVQGKETYLYYDLCDKLWFVEGK